MKTKKLLFVFGTRPEVIKLAPVIRRAKENPRFEVKVCSTGQHKEMIQPLLEFFAIKPDFDLGLMRPKPDLTDLVTAAMVGVRDIIRQEKPDYAVIQGDTSTCLATALAAFHEKCPLAHVEAGLRSGDIQSPWPEELNRKAVTLVAAQHFSPTSRASKVLESEGVAKNAVHLVGNTVIDALLDVSQRIDSDKDLQKSLSDRFHFLDSSKRLLLVTTHRRESFSGGLESILNALKDIAREPDVQILFAVHLNPEVRKQVAAVLEGTAVWVDRLKGSSHFFLCDPLPYLEFVYLMKKAYFILSDSGGVQEEAPGLGKPVLVLREVTERPEAVEAGTSALVGFEQKKITAMAHELLTNVAAYKKMAQAKNPFGDGHSSEKILEILGL